MHDSALSWRLYCCILSRWTCFSQIPLWALLCHVSNWPFQCTGCNTSSACDWGVLYHTCFI